MNPIPVKERYALAELAALGLPGLPGSKRGWEKLAEREGWPFEEVPGKGGRGGVRREYEPPAAVMAVIKAKAAEQLLAQAEALPAAAGGTALATRQAANSLAKAEVKVEALTDKQRACADARCALAAKVLELAAVMGKDRAVRHLVEAAAAGGLPEHLQALVPVANAKANAERALSRRTLYTWVGWYEQAETPTERLRLMAPGKPAKDLSTPAWGPAFLACYRRPQKPSVQEAYGALCATLGTADKPSIHQVRRWLDKLPAEVLYRGRNTGAALKAKLPYVARDWSVFRPNEVWMGDGHGMKLKVAHPDHGKPCQPEVTLIMDCASRRIVGWSLALSESALAVCDALRRATRDNGPSLIYYSDNGGGQKNKMLDAGTVGVLGRLGVHHETGRPGNPQGRGLVERLHQTVLIRLARQFETSLTKATDREHIRVTGKGIERAVDAIAKGKELDAEHKRYAKKLPSWKQFLDALLAAIDWYNTEHEHSALPKNPATGRFYTPQAYWDAHYRPEEQMRLSREELHDLFMPAEVRQARRGQVELFNGIYYHPDLRLVDGELVQVCYEWDDPSFVVVKTMTGERLCIAERDGNKKPGFELSRRDQLREQRADNRAERLNKQLDEVEEERKGTFSLAVDNEPLLSGLTTVRAPIQRSQPVAVNASLPAEVVAVELQQLRAEGPAVLRAEAEPEGPMQRHRRWLALDGRQSRGETLAGNDWEFWKSYRMTSEFEAMQELTDWSDAASM